MRALTGLIVLPLVVACGAETPSQDSTTDPKAESTPNLADSDGDVDDGPGAGPGAGPEKYELEGDDAKGRWRPARIENPALAERIAELEAIGYADGYHEAEERSDVTVHDPERAWQGLNLVVSGHGPEAILMDMQGNALHTWRRGYHEAVPGHKKKYPRDFYRRAWLYPNGDLLAIFKGHVLAKLDVESNVLWTFKGNPHHDLEVLDDGRIAILTRKAHVLPRIHPTDPVLEDFVSILGPRGKELQRVSVLECFENSELKDFLDGMEVDGDLLHTNTIEVLDGRHASKHPAFAAGNVLVSCLKTDTIAVLDLDEEKAVWARRDGWKAQHQPTFLPDGSMLVFDNQGDPSGNGTTRVIELDPATGEVAWTYAGLENDPLETRSCGSNQRLPNGNTLITESDNGRALEVTPEGETVWEYVNPHRAGENGRLVATLFEVVRLPEDYCKTWLVR